MEVVVLVVLALVLAFLAGGLFWQERARPPEPRRAVVYGVDEATDYVWERLPEPVRSEVRRADVRRILEWELHYLQQPRLRDENTPAVVGGVEAARYLQERAFEHGFAYEPESIFAVLELQAAYLAAIGAVGDPAAEDAG